MAVAHSNIPAAYFGHCNNEDYSRQQGHCFQLSRTIHGTRNCTLVPFSDSQQSGNKSLLIINFDVFRKRRVALAKNEASPDSIAGFVAC